MTESEATRKMTFDEEYEILQAEKNELFADEDEHAEPPFANCVVRRALRCIRKLKEEREQYRAIGTVSEFREAMFFKKYFMELYGEGLEVANWHQNGDLEPLDNFIDEAVECGKQEECEEHE